MKRFLSLTLTVAMLVSLLALAVPAAIANDAIRVILRPVAGTPDKLAPGESFKLEVVIEDPQNRQAHSINAMRIFFDSRIVDWDVPSGGGLPFRCLRTGDLVYLPTEAYYSDIADSPRAEFNANFNFAAIQAINALIPFNVAGKLLELDFKVKDTAYGGPWSVGITVESIILGNHTYHKFETDSAIINVDGPPPPQAHNVTINGEVVNNAYVMNTIVTISAPAAPARQTFSHWTSVPEVEFANAESASTNFIMPDSPVALTANYVPLPTHRLTVLNSPNISGIVEQTASADYSAGDIVRLDAGIISSHGFDGWTVTSGDVNIINPNHGTMAFFVMPDAPVTITANWLELRYILTRTAGANGRIEDSFGNRVAPRTEVTLTAVPNSGYRFVNWTAVGLSEVSYTANPIKVTMPINDVALVANFELIPVNIVTVNGVVTGTHAQGSQVTVNAGTPPVAGYTFSAWKVNSGGVSIPGTASATFTMPGEPVSVEAVWNPPGVEAFGVTVGGVLLGTYIAGTSVEIHAGTRAGFVFTGWTVNSGGAVVAESWRASTTFTMPANAVSLTANWREDNPTVEFPPERDPAKPPSLDNFTKDRTYASGIFNDLPPNADAAEWVIKAFEYGIIAGIGNNQFGSNSNMLVQEAITIAAKMHMIYTTGTTANLSYPHGYISYARSNYLIDDEFEGGYGRAATRAELVRIWAYILSPRLLIPQNTVLSLPDVSETHPYYIEIAGFYEAGLLTGKDSSGTFAGDENVIRAHAAVIFVKLIELDLRTRGASYGN
jgi:uncharacterized repeat protein (TIGR02543 family)